MTLAVNIGAGATFAPEKPAKPGYAIAVTERAASDVGAPKDVEPPMETMMARSSDRTRRLSESLQRFTYLARVLELHVVLLVVPFCPFFGVTSGHARSEKFVAVFCHARFSEIGNYQPQGIARK
jgi:hypothetical protein